MSANIKVVHQDTRIYMHVDKLFIYANIGLPVEDAVKLAKTILASVECGYASTNLQFENGGFGIGKHGEEIKPDF